MGVHVRCRKCGGSFDVRTYREFTVCPYCGDRVPFPGFEYKPVDPDSSMFANVKYWMDCPACRSQYAYLGPEGKKWRCPDCGYTITDKEKNRSVFWFCDNCDAFLNVQDGFTEKSGKWTCTECKYENDVTKENLF